MVERIHQGLGSLIWRSLIAVIILLAIYVTGTRALLQLLPQIRGDLVSELSRRFGADIRVGNITGDVVGFAPQISLDNVHVTLPGDAGFVIDLSGAAFTIDPWATLTALEPRLDSLRLEGSSVSVRVGNYSGEEGDADLSIVGDLLQVFRKVTVGDSRIELIGQHGNKLVFDLGIELRREGSQRQFRVRLGESGQNYLAFEGEGVGNLLDPAQFAGEIHGELRSRHIGDVAALMTDLNVGGSADIDFWYRVKNGSPSLTFSAALGDLVLGSSGAVGADAGQESQSLTVNALSAQALARPTDQGWLVTIEQLHAAVAEAHVVLDRLQLETRGQQLRMSLADLNVARAVEVLLATGVLPGEAQEIVTALAPSGQLVALKATFEDVANPLRRWTAAAEVMDATTQPAFDVPGLYGIDATLEGNQDGATAWIDTQHFGLDLQGIYASPILAERVRGKLSAHWRSDALFLEQGVLAVAATDHKAMVQFGIDIPFSDEASLRDPLAMFLDVGLSEAPVGIRQNYIPVVIPEDLFQWLDSAIEGGQVESGAFVWRGGFDDFGGGDQSMQLGLSLSQGQLAFQPDWPPVENLEASLLVDTDRVSVWGGSGQIAGLDVSDVSVELDGDTRSNQLRIRGDGRGDVQQAVALLRSSPVNDLAGEVLSDLDIKGSLTGQVKLGFSLEELAQDPTVQVAIKLSDTTFDSTTLDLGVADISGDLSFDLDTGFSSRRLAATLFDQPVSIAIGPGTTGLDDTGILDARFVSTVSADDVVPWLGRVSGLGTPEKPLEPYASGEALVTVDLAVGEQANVRVSSDLQGLSLDLPVPIGKRAEQKAPFLLEFEVGDAPWEAFWYRRMQGRFYRQEGQFVGATLDVTPRWRRTTLSDSPMTEGVYISGKLPRIELEPWLAVWEELSVLGQDSEQITPVIIERVTLQSVLFAGVDVGPVNVDLTPFDTWDMLGVNADWLDAELTLRHDGLPSSLILNALNLDRVPDFVGKKPVAEDGEAVQDPESVEWLDAEESGLVDPVPLTEREPQPEPPELTAPLVVVIANLTYHDTDLGAATFTVTSGDGVLEAQHIRGNLADISLLDGSQLIWQRDPTTEIFDTRLTLNGEVENLGNTFKALDIEPPVETRSGRLVADLSWPGGPDDIDLMALSGNVNVQLREGSFLPVPAGATGFVRILGVLNLAGLFERANVTRLFEPGVAFKKAAGQLRFAPGRIEIPDFEVEGPGGGFRIDSDIDLINETIDGELIVTLPLAENIPWVAALAGGIPVAAGVYLVSKVFEDQVKSLSSGVYSVEGPLASPDVNFVRVFDATSSKVREGETPSEGRGEDAGPGSGADYDPGTVRDEVQPDQSLKDSSETSSPVGSTGGDPSEGNEASSSSRR